MRYKPLLSLHCHVVAALSRPVLREYVKNCALQILVATHWLCIQLLYGLRLPLI